VALIILDASIVIAATDSNDDLHAASIDALRQRADDEFRLPASAYAECLVGPARVDKLELARRSIGKLGAELVPIDERIATRSAELRAASRSLRLPDALVLACGDVLDAPVVLTADRRWAHFERVRVIGPARP
jgi:predicted nucleic acid-binding protein